MTEATDQISTETLAPGAAPAVADAKPPVADNVPVSAPPSTTGYTKIHSHPNGPSSIDATEFGDTWHAAMTKIDRMFHVLFHKVSGPIEHAVTATDDAAHAAIKDLENQIAAMQIKHDALVAQVNATPPVAPVA